MPSDGGTLGVRAVKAYYVEVEVLPSEEGRKHVRKLLEDYMLEHGQLRMKIEDMTLYYNYEDGERENAEVDRAFLKFIEDADFVVIFDESGESWPYVLKVVCEDRSKDVLEEAEKFLMLFLDLFGVKTGENFRRSVERASDFIESTRASFGEHEALGAECGKERVPA